MLIEENQFSMCYMGSYVIIFVVIIILGLFTMYIYSTQSSTMENFNKAIVKKFYGTEGFKTVNVKVDGMDFKMADYKNKRDAAEFLKSISVGTRKFIDNLVDKYPKNPAVKRLSKRFKIKNIAEVDPRNGDGATSFVVNKGAEIGFCIRSQEHPEQFTDTNPTKFVVLHELSHLASKSYGHNEEFKRNFIFLLNEANKQGFYQDTDFSRNPYTYCGLVIDERPVNYG